VLRLLLWLLKVLNVSQQSTGKEFGGIGIDNQLLVFAFQCLKQEQVRIAWRRILKCFLQLQWSHILPGVHSLPVGDFLVTRQQEVEICTDFCCNCKDISENFSVELWSVFSLLQ
jgi:hypothetical protein